MDNYLLLKILLLPLATWRLYRLFATDTGWHCWLRRLRIKLGVEYGREVEHEGQHYFVENDYSIWKTEEGSLAEGITCCWCATLWWGILLTGLLLLAPTWLFLLIVLPLNVGSFCLFYENGIYSRLVK